MLRKTKEYKQRPNCKQCEHNNICNHGEKDCTKYIGWVRPCLQGCIEHDKPCIYEQAILMQHLSLKDCKGFKRMT